MFKPILASAQVNNGKNTEINKQLHVKLWLNLMKYGAVSYSLSCNKQLQDVLGLANMYLVIFDMINFCVLRKTFRQKLARNLSVSKIEVMKSIF